MDIVEYKKNKVRDKDGNYVSEHPHWLEWHGFWYNSADKTYVGMNEDLSDRDYYVPDSITVLTKEDFQARWDSMSAEDQETAENEFGPVEDWIASVWDNANAPTPLKTAEEVSAIEVSEETGTHTETSDPDA